MRASVIIRGGVCCFPGCRVEARACDLDHLVAYVPLDQGGPPGQTSLEDLACLCRRHHRLKTFTAGTCLRLTDGRYRWTSPHGHAYFSVPDPKTDPLTPLTPAQPLRDGSSRPLVTIRTPDGPWKVPIVTSGVHGPATGPSPARRPARWSRNAPRTGPGRCRS